MHLRYLRTVRCLAACLCLLLLAACAADDNGAADADPGDDAAEEPDDDDVAANGEFEERTLRLATIRSTADPAHAGAERFAEIVEEETGGAVEVEIYPDSQLGDFTDLFADMQAGNLDMFYEGISIYPTLDGAEAFLVTSVPFMWESYEQLQDVMASDRFATLFEEAGEQTGVRAVAVSGDKEPRALSANQPIESADDMAGLSIRIAEAEMPQEFARELGAQPEVIPLSDLYLSLQQGVADAQENGAITMVTQSLYEVQDYFMPTDYIRDIEVFYMSEAIWDDLEPELQEIMTEAGEEAGEVVTAQVEEQMDAAMETLEENLEVVEPDVDSFESALEGTFEQFDGDLWPEGLLEETRGLADEAG